MIPADDAISFYCFPHLDSSRPVFSIYICSLRESVFFLPCLLTHIPSIAGLSSISPGYRHLVSFKTCSLFETAARSGYLLQMAASRAATGRLAMTAISERCSIAMAGWTLMHLPMERAMNQL